MDAFPLFPGLDDSNYGMPEGSQALPNQTMAASPTAFSFAQQPFSDDHPFQYSVQPASNIAAVDPSTLSGQPQTLPSLAPSTSASDASRSRSTIITLAGNFLPSYTPGSSTTFSVRLPATRTATDMSRFRVHFGNQSVDATVLGRSRGQSGQGDDLRLGVVVPHQPTSLSSSGRVPLAIDAMDEACNMLQPHTPLGYVQYQGECSSLNSPSCVRMFQSTCATDTARIDFAQHLWPILHRLEIHLFPSKKDGSVPRHQKS